MPVFKNLIDPFVDIGGVDTADQNKTLLDESLAQGDQVASGSPDAAFTFSSPTVTLTDSGAAFTASLIGNFITIAGATSGGNNGTFVVTGVPSGTTIEYENAAGVAEAQGSATYDIREWYTHSDDTNFTRTDRRLIKGTTNYYDDIPTYQRPSAVGTTVPANLTNIAGNTMDAFAFICDQKFENQAVAEGSTLVTLTSVGNLQHADAVDRTGVPLQDGADAANLESCYTEIINPSTGRALTVDGRAIGQIDCDSAGTGVLPADTETVIIDDGSNPAVTFEFDTNASVVETATLKAVDISAAANEDDVKNALITAIQNARASGDLNIIAENGGAGLVNLTNDTPGVAGNVAITDTVVNANFTVTGMTGGSALAGQRIFGFTQAGGSTEPNSVEVAFYSLPAGDPLATTNPYTWERNLPTTVDIYFPFRDLTSNLDENCWRRTLVHGLVGDAGVSTSVANLQSSVGVSPTDTDLSGLLTNTGNFYPFAGLDSDPTVVEALNQLNTEVGNRDYSAGAISNVAGLADGQTITASIEALALAIGTASVSRVIERLTSAIPANTAHTLPGGNTYTLDPTNNGSTMWVFWRKQLRDPGPVGDSNDYEETSTTQITPYRRIRASDNINYMIYTP